MIALSIGLLIGFLMCIPIGPINVWVINTHVKKGAFRALSIALGGSVMDFIYFFVILSGLSLFVFSDQIIFYLKLAGIIIIFLLGTKELISKQDNVKNVAIKNNVKNILGAFLFGIILYVSNPTLLLTMTGLGAYVKTLTFFTSSVSSNLFVSIGLGLGSFIWFACLIAVVNKYQETIRNKYLGLFAKISGALMITLSLLMGHQLFY